MPQDEIPDPQKEIPDNKLIGGDTPLKPIWIVLVIVGALIILVLGIHNWYQKEMKKLQTESSFFHVSNRELSLFLWQNPRFMRVNVSTKDAYLPGFQYLDKVTPEEGMADNIAQAPPNVLFQYHTWKRLLGGLPVTRSIPKQQFLEFLKDSDEWQPGNWPGEPPTFSEFVKKLPESSITDLKSVSFDILPNEIRMAFIGWKNYYREGKEINDLKPTYALLERLLSAAPNYNRNFWRNIVMEAEQSYLLDYFKGTFKADDPIPSDQISPFLRVALFNQKKTEEEIAGQSTETPTTVHSPKESQKS